MNDLTTQLEYELNRLESRHKILDENIARGYTNYLDDKHLHKMKQEKLVIKQRIVDVRERLRNR